MINSSASRHPGFEGTLGVMPIKVLSEYWRISRGIKGCIYIYVLLSCFSDGATYLLDTLVVGGSGFSSSSKKTCPPGLHFSCSTLSMMEAAYKVAPFTG